MDVRTDSHTYGMPYDNQNFSDQWVTKFSKVWCSACGTPVGALL